MGIFHQGNLLGRYASEVERVSNLVVDLVLDLGKHILHVHNGTFKLEAVATGTIDVGPRLVRRLFILLKGCLRDTLQMVVIELLVGFEEAALALLHLIYFEILHQSFHDADLVALGHELKPLLLLVLALPHVMRQRVANLGMVEIALANIVVRIQLLV